MGQAAKGQRYRRERYAVRHPASDARYERRTEGLGCEAGKWNAATTSDFNAHKWRDEDVGQEGGASEGGNSGGGTEVEWRRGG